jgi:beta-glucosidase
VVEALGDSVDWYCTINEPGIVAVGGYLGMLGFPPGARGLANWRRAADGLIAGHRRARAAVKELRPSARVGQTHAMLEWESNAGGRPMMNFSRRMSEDVFLEASKEDDFIGVQTYTRVQLQMARPVGWLARPVLAAGPLTRLLMWVAMSRVDLSNPPAPNPNDGVRRTQMGYEFRPQAVAATVRRVAELLPGKPIIVTEHGLATADDAERIEFITGGLAALHAVIADGIPLGGYIHWSAFDNFEWDKGYSMTFGMIGVDRETQVRTVRPSARFLGEIARNNKLVVAGS